MKGRAVCRGQSVENPEKLFVPLNYVNIRLLLPKMFLE
jgi:hypothetical protein